MDPGAQEDFRPILDRQKKKDFSNAQDQPAVTKAFGLPAVRCVQSCGSDEFSSEDKYISEQFAPKSEEGKHRNINLAFVLSGCVPTMSHRIYDTPRLLNPLFLNILIVQPELGLHEKRTRTCGSQLCRHVAQRCLSDEADSTCLEVSELLCSTGTSSMFR